MKLYSLFIIISVSIATFFKASKPKEILPENANINMFWNNFITAVHQGEAQKFVSDSVRCYDCFQNTNTEKQVFKNLKKTNKYWQFKVYKDLVYVKRDTFLQNDIPVFFNTELSASLSADDIIAVKREHNTDTVYEILLNTTQSSKITESTCVQYGFIFTKTAEDYKLSEMYIIP